MPKKVFFITPLKSYMNSTPEKYRPLVRAGLRDYQITGVQFIESLHGRAVIGDPMGLGKTVQAIGYAKINPELRPVLVVCPASLKINWQREIKEWAGERAVTLSGRMTHELPPAPWYIINYDILAYRDPDSEEESLVGWYIKLVEEPFKLVVFDEIQTLSNRTIKSRASVSIARSIQKRVLLSGTPIRSCPAEFFTALNMVAPHDFSSRSRYNHRYCEPKFVNRKWEYKGATNLEELHQRIKKYMIRREKSEVLPQLPEKQKQIVHMEVEGMNAYRKADAEFMAWLQKNKKRRVNPTNYFTALKQKAYIAKRNGVIQWLRDFIATGEKLVVFTYHVKALKDIVSQFPGAVYIDGSVPNHLRQGVVDQFQDPNGAQLLVGQIEAAGVGLTMTAASCVAVVELGWTPSDMEQAEDRIHRLTQTASRVMIYYLIAPGTIEELILEILNRKSEVVGAVIDGRSSQLLKSDAREELTVEYRKMLKKKRTSIINYGNEKIKK